MKEMSKKLNSNADIAHGKKLDNMYEAQKIGEDTEKTTHKIFSDREFGKKYNEKFENKVEALWEVHNLTELELPQQIVFIDVNGTLIPDNSRDGSIPEEDLSLLRQSIRSATDKGLSFGLCSDSPLPQLKEFSEKIGLSGPILAENGNIVAYKNKMHVIRKLDLLEEYKTKISEKAQELNYKRETDSIAPEFGGKEISSTSASWSFGANRKTSITVFGPAQLIETLGKTFEENSEYSIDVSPEYNYFAIHPGSNYKVNKGKTLTELSNRGHGLVMVGNSLSDWVEPNSEIKCAFVADSKIPKNIVEKAMYVSDKPLAKGVSDILNKLN